MICKILPGLFRQRDKSLDSSYEVYGGLKKYSLPQQKTRAYSLCWNYEEIILSFFLSSPNMGSFLETFTDPISRAYNRMYAFVYR